MRRNLNNNLKKVSYFLFIAVLAVIFFVLFFPARLVNAVGEDLNQIHYRWRSDDGGENTGGGGGTTWSDADTGGSLGSNILNALATSSFSSIDYVYVAGDSGTLFRTTSGTVWTDADIGNNLGINKLIALKFYNGYLYVSGDAGLIYRTSNGTTWTDAVVLGNLGANKINSLEAFGSYLYAAGDNGTLYRTLDGTTWTDADIGDNLGINKLRALESYNGYLYVSGDNGIIYRTSDGTTWSDAVVLGNLGANKINSLENFSGYLYAAGDSGTLQRTADGTTWADSSTGLGGGKYTTLKTASFNGLSYLYVGGDDGAGNGIIFRTSNGTSWNDADPGNSFTGVKLNAIETAILNDPGYIYVSGDLGTMFKTESWYGATFSAVEDTAITGVIKGDTHRIRFEVSNEGTAGAPATAFDIQVAETSVCSSGTYVSVPVGAGSDWQITGSSFITDGEQTSNISNGLTDESTTFISGELKDTGNTTGNITLGVNEFTEVEYSISATSLATDGGSYCFRLGGVNTYNVYALSTIINYPSVSTVSVTNISFNSADADGVVTNEGGGTVTDRGFVYATSAGPVIGGPGVTQVQVGSGSGTYNTNISGLSADTTYYLRAYATNGAGTSYGNDIQFATLTPTAPSVTSDSVTNITDIAADFDGTVVDDGGAPPVTDRGFVYATSANPSIGGPGVTQIQKGSGTGSFNKNISSLIPGTIYYMRSYGINSVGEGYGNDIQFSTDPMPSPPTVTTDSVTNIIDTKADADGTVVNGGGGTVTERGFVYAENPSPVIGGPGVTQIQRGSGIGTFNKNISGFNPETVYYLRAYGINYGGEGYGNDIQFTTLASNNPPNVDSYTDLPDPVPFNASNTFTISWSDSDPSDSVKIHICGTDKINKSSSGGSCKDNSWISSSATTTSPVKLTLLNDGSNLGIQNYYVFVCDDNFFDPRCSSGGNSGTFDNLPAFDFNLSDVFNGIATTSSSINFPVTANLVAGLSETVSFTYDLSNLPGDVTTQVDIYNCNPTCISTLTVNTSSSTPAGTYQMTVTAQSATAGPKQKTFNLVVATPVSCDFYVGDKKFNRVARFDKVYRDINGKIVQSGGVQDTNTAKVTITVSWLGRKGYKSESLSFYLSNLFNN